MSSSFRTAILIALMLLAPTAIGETRYVPIEQRTSAEERRVAGLHKLSANELAALNALLELQQQDLLSVAASDPSADRREVPREAITARIDGPFSGWRAGSDIRLANGQVWRIIDGSLYTERVDAPAVRIEPGLLGAWYLKVDGQTNRAKVRRIK